MTAVTETAPALSYDAEVIAQAHGVFTRAKDQAGEWPDPARRVIGDAVLDLAQALKDYSDLRNGTVPWWFSGVMAGQAGRDQALRMAAEKAREAAGDVCDAIEEHCGGQAAALVNGDEGGEGNV